MKTCDGISPGRKHTKPQTSPVSTILPVPILLSKKKPQQLTNKRRKRVKFHHSAKTCDGISLERKRKLFQKQQHMKLQSRCNYHVQLERLFSDFWSEECRLTALNELVVQRNLAVLAALSSHIFSLMHRLEQCPTEIFVPLLETGGEKHFALCKAHLYHVRHLFLYVSIAHNKCVRICAANAAQEGKCTDLKPSKISA